MQTLTRLLMLCFLLCDLLPAAQAQPDSPPAPISLGGELRGLAYDPFDPALLVGEGWSLVRVPLLGDSAYQAAERLYLGAAVVDVAGHERAVIVLTENGLVAVSPDGRRILNRVAGGGEQLRIYGDTVLLAAREGGVRLYTLLPDGQLRARALLDTPGNTLDVALSDTGVLGVADGNAGLRLYAADTLQPVGELLMTAHHITGRGSLFYVADEGEMRVIDTSNPATPRIMGRYTPPRAIRRVASDGNWTVVADAESGLKVYDRQLRYQNGESARPALDVALTGGLLIAARPDSLQFYDATRLPQWVERGTFPLWDSPTALTTAGSLIAVALGESGIVLLQRETLSLVAYLSVRGDITDIAIQGTLAYLTLRDGRVVVVDITNPGQPQVAAVLETSGSPQDISLTEGFMALASGNGGFSLFSLENPLAPRRIALLPALSYAHAALLTDSNRLFLQDGERLRAFLRDGSGAWAESLSQPAIAGTLVFNGRDLISAGANRIALFDPLTLTPGLAYASPRYITEMMLAGQDLLLGGDTPELVLLDVGAQPIERRMIPLAATPETILSVNENFFLLEDGARVVHLNAAGERVGVYQALGGITALMESGTGLLLRGENGIYASTPPYARFEAHIAAPLGENLLSADANRLSLSHRDGQTLATWDLTTPLTAMTADSAGWWLFADADGGLWSLSLTDSAPRLQTTLPYGDISALYARNNRLYIGTEAGRLGQWENGTFSDLTRFNAPVRQIVNAPDQTLLIATGAGGLWHITADGAVTQRASHAYQVAVAPGGGYIAVAGGMCGLQTLEWQSFASFYPYQGGMIQAVAFAGQTLWVVENGVARPVISDEMASPLPVNAYPVGYSAQPITRLTWQPESGACGGVQYEVWLNGQALATVNAPEYPLTRPLQGQGRWQIVAVNQDGERLRSPEWRYRTAHDGWTATPQRFTLQLSQPKSAFPLSSRWIGLLLVLLGLVGLWRIAQRWL